MSRTFRKTPLSILTSREVLSLTRLIDRPQRDPYLRGRDGVFAPAHIDSSNDGRPIGEAEAFTPAMKRLAKRLASRRRRRAALGKIERGLIEASV